MAVSAKTTTATTQSANDPLKRLKDDDGDIVTNATYSLSQTLNELVSFVRKHKLKLCMRVHTKKYKSFDRTTDPEGERFHTTTRLPFPSLLKNFHACKEDPETQTMYLNGLDPIEFDHNNIKESCARILAKNAIREAIDTIVKHATQDPSIDVVGYICERVPSSDGKRNHARECRELIEVSNGRRLSLEEAKRQAHVAFRESTGLMLQDNISAGGKPRKRAASRSRQARQEALQLASLSSILRNAK